MSKKAELAKNTFIIGLGRLLPQAITFLLIPIYTTFLSPDEYGTVDLILTYIALFAPIIAVSLEMAAFRFLIDARGRDDDIAKIITNVLYASTLFALPAIALYIIIGYFINIPYFYIILLSVCGAIFSNLFLQVARGLGNNKKYAQGSILASIFTIVLNILFIVILKIGAEGMLLAMACGSIVNAVYLFWSLRLYKHIKYKSVDKQLAKQLLGYSLPLVPHGIAWWTINAAGRTIIVLALGVTSNGIMAIAYKFPLIFTGIYSVFGMSWTESASMHINSKDRDKFFTDTFNMSVKLFASLNLGIIIAIPFVFNILVSKNFAEAYLYIPILLIAAFLNSIVGLYGAIFIAKKMTRQVLTTSLLAAAISIGLNVIMIPFMGLYAAALSPAIAFFGMAIFRHYDLKKHVTITYEKGLFLKLSALYTVALSLYYINTVVGNIVNAIVITAIVLYLNRSVIQAVKMKVLKTLSR